MAHTHSVVDTDTHFFIDANTRKIRADTEINGIVIQYDHNSERFTFEMPRYIDNHDMSKCDLIQVHYSNINESDRKTANGVYSVTDLAVSGETEDKVVLSWLISQNATQYIGSLIFAVRFACTDGNGNVEYSWNTSPCKDVFVGEGINNTGAVEKNYADIIAEFESRLDALESGGILVDDELNEDSNNPIQNATVAKALFPILLDLSEIKSQTSTVKKNAKAGSKVGFVVNDKKWVKDTVIKITVSADESLISGKMTFGVKYEDDTSITQIATPLINEEVTYALTSDTREIAVYIPKEHVVGNGEVTLTIESVGLKTEVVELKEKVSNIENDIENLRNETPVVKSSIEGKTFSILGDSASAYAGWVPENQKSYYGNPDENKTNVSSVSQMWWYILSSQLKMSLLTNDSWMGTTVSTTGYKNKDTNIPADMTASAFTTRAKSTFCENNTTSIKPDYIFTFGGINDKLAGSPIGKTQYSDWDDESLKSVVPSFCKLIHDIKLYNPHATIINITFDKLIGSGIDVGYAEACKYYGITNIVLSSIDITVGSGHPSWEGQLSIAEQVIAKLGVE